MSDNTDDRKPSEEEKPPEVVDPVVKTDPEVDEQVEDLQAQDRSDVLPWDVQIRNMDSDDATTMKLLRQGVRLKRGLITPRVFYPAIIVLLLTAAISIIFPDASGQALLSTQSWIVDTLGWYYILIMFGFIIFCLYVALSKYGRIKLGAPEDEPEFSRGAWFSMLFATGMGIGLIFYGVGEPLTYATVDPKPGWEGSPEELAQMGMAQTFLHWGLHPWAVYGVLGLGVAYTIHRRGRPVSIRWVFEPLIGAQRVRGWMGDTIDVLAIFGTMAGVATSLGLGVQQIATGLQHLGIVDQADTTLLVILIIVITFIATASVVSGIGKGMKWISSINLSLAGVLVVSVLLLGPTLFLVENFIESLGVWLANFLEMSFDVGAYATAEDSTWYSSWTLFYWGWWIAWAPFVGIFIARVSRGRTIREFIIGVMLVPTLVGMIWFGVLGGSGIYRQLFGERDLVVDGEVSPEGSLFTVLQDLPLGTVFSVIGIILVVLFFITSSDSGSLVMNMLTAGGHPNPPTWSRIMFSGLEGAIAIGLLLAGGLEGLQAASLATALPFSIIMVFMALAVYRGLRLDSALATQAQLERRMKLFSEHVGDLYHLDEAEGADRLTPDSEPIDYRIAATTGPRPRNAPGKRMRDLRKVHDARTSYERGEAQRRRTTDDDA
ncbi:BCCT family transporter [Enteractinococcus coprophilus]|uniref:Choline/glycine/proline betaine transport protein n=1 Tax=Enteractinococcus coprophilus TaxID=1027633 RepID=A0A543AG62_9MICC|nr:BCCT family transporter [Enteractinococcus coprophilus]TQL71569.1 choline/glycine/proline betaine transport protein [Enteractinococcus coprophilus]